MTTLYSIIQKCKINSNERIAKFPEIAMRFFFGAACVFRSHDSWREKKERNSFDRLKSERNLSMGMFLQIVTFDLCVNALYLHFD